MLPTENKFTLEVIHATGKVIFRALSVEVSIRSSNTLTQPKLLFLNTAVVYLAKASLL